MTTPTAAQIIQEVLCDYHGDESGWDVLAEELIAALREAGVDLDNRYALPDVGIGQPWTAFAHWTETGEERTQLIGRALYVRHALGGAS